MNLKDIIDLVTNIKIIADVSSIVPLKVSFIQTQRILFLYK